MDCMNMLLAPFCSLHTLNWAGVNCALSNPQVISDAFKFPHQPPLIKHWLKKVKKGKSITRE